jgi:hypothetical protein
MAGNDCCRKRPRASNLNATCSARIPIAAIFLKWKLLPYAKRRVGSVLELATSSSGIYSGKLTPQGPSSGLDLKAHEYFALLVPEAKGEKSKARQQGDGLDRIEERICLMTLLEMVIGNAGTQMMNMMKANIAGKPL